MITKAEHKEELCAVRADVELVAAANQALAQRNALEDPREIVVRGIPASVALEPPQIATKLLTALNLPHLSPLVTGWREWNPPPRATPVDRVAAQPADNVAATTRGTGLHSRALVLTLACPSTRDDILKKTPGLRNLNCQAIFGAGGTSKLSVNALWSGPVYNLLKRASAVYRSLGYERSIVKNMTVFMRPSKTTPLIPIYHETDLGRLATTSS